MLGCLVLDSCETNFFLNKTHTYEALGQRALIFTVPGVCGVK